MSSNQKAQHTPKAPGVAAKALIIHDNEVLLLLRCDDDEHCPNVWEIPGGRLEPGEDPHVGLQRETIEEAGININVLEPLDVQHFTRDDGQVITGTIFRCAIADKNTVTLSEEHKDYEWVPLDDPLIPDWMHIAIERATIYQKAQHS